MPSLLLNALPKSASTYLAELLRRGLNAHPIELSVGIFPDDLLLFSRVQTFAGGGQFARQHVPATAANLAYLRRFGVRPIIHLRDPRAALVSWTHHLSEAAGGWDEVFWYYPSICPPRDFFVRDFAWRLEWCFEHHFDVFVRWIADWCAAADVREIEVLFTTYEDLVSNEAGVLARMAAFTGLADRFQRVEVVPSAALLLREGRVDGWREPAQRRIQWATARMPSDFWRRFGWLP